MDKYHKVLELDKILETLSGFAQSDLGRLRCLNTPVFEDFKRIEHELKLTSRARQLLDNALFPPLNHIRSLNFRASAALDAQEIFDFAYVLNTSRLMKGYLEKNSQIAQQLADFSYNLYCDKDFEDKIFNTFESDLTVKDSASLELKRLRSSLRDIEANLKTTIQRLLATPSFNTHLQEAIYTFRNERVVFQVKASDKSKVKGIVHDVSASGQTFFIEPESIVQINNRIKQTEAQINAEIAKILRELSNEIKCREEDIEKSLNTLTELDFIFAKAKYSIKINGIEPELSSEKIIKMEGMLHPILLETAENPVKNDFYMDETTSTLIITGSNTGGKTVTLKTVGLSLLMMKAGLHIAAFEAKIYPFHAVFADIGDEQNIAQSLSTFSSHISNIINILNSANNASLVLLDELGAGTDPQEGASLAQAILFDLKRKGAFTLITTHYGELNSLAYTKEGFKNASVEFDLNTLKPTYNLLIGIPGSSNALEIAKNLGMDSEIIDEARKISTLYKNETHTVLKELQKTQNELSKSAQEAKESEAEVKNLREEYEQKLLEVKKEKKKAGDIFKKKYDSEISKARAEIKDILEELRHNKSEKIARRSYARLAKLESRLREENSPPEDETSSLEPLNAQEIKIGESVYIKNLNQNGVILTLPDKNNNVSVQIGLLKTVLPLDKLAKPQNTAQKTSRKIKGVTFNKIQISNTLDLRGFRVEEGLCELESYLDKASLANLSPVYIIHGFGTGALKEAVRDFVKTSPYVAKFRAGEKGEGDDGVTVIDLK